MKRLIFLAVIAICALTAQARDFHLVAIGEAYCHGKVLSNGVAQFGEWVHESFDLSISNQKMSIGITPEQNFYIPIQYVDLQNEGNNIWKATGEIQTVDNVKGVYSVTLSTTGESEIIVKYGKEAWKYRVRIELFAPDMETRAPTDAKVPSRNGVGTSIVAKRSSSAKPGKPQ